MGSNTHIDGGSDIHVDSGGEIGAMNLLQLPPLHNQILPTWRLDPSCRWVKVGPGARERGPARE